MALSKKQHKELLEQTLQANVTFKSIGGIMPFRIVIDGFFYNVYIKIFHLHILRQKTRCLMFGVLNFLQMTNLLK